MTGSWLGDPATLVPVLELVSKNMSECEEGSRVSAKAWDQDDPGHRQALVQPAASLLHVCC